jgi:hypothetical protein
MNRKPVLILILIAVSLLAQSQEVKFGVFTDAHYADIPPRGAKEYDQSLVKLKECVDSMNSAGVDFLIELGDFKDMPQPPSEEKALIFLYRAEKILRQFSGPVYHVLGNHDMDCISKQQFFEVTANQGISLQSGYYSFDCKGIHCIVLDANYDSLGKDYSKGQFEWGDSNIPDHELKWLKKDLKKAKGSVIVFIHQRLDGSGPYFIRNASAVRKVLEGSDKVMAVFQGHYHEGYYQLMNDIHYYTLRAMVDGGGKTGNSFAVVSVSSNAMKVQGFGTAQSISFGISE